MERASSGDPLCAIPGRRRKGFRPTYGKVVPAVQREAAQRRAAARWDGGRGPRSMRGEAGGVLMRRR